VDHAGLRPVGGHDGHGRPLTRGQAPRPLLGGQVDSRVAGGAPSNNFGSDWLSLEAATARFGLTERWLADHRRQLRLRGIVSKPSRKTTLYHARRLARFLDERSRP
jgi:hypothetical protein